MNFNPYHKWLGISDAEVAPDHYRLLGLEKFETDIDVIAASADRQMAHVRKYQTGSHSLLSQKLLNELAVAKVCLLDPQKKQQYDNWLAGDGNHYSTPFEINVHTPIDRQRSLWKPVLAIGAGLVCLFFGMGFLRERKKNVKETQYFNKKVDVVVPTPRQVTPGIDLTPTESSLEPMLTGDLDVDEKPEDPQEPARNRQGPKLAGDNRPVSPAEAAIKTGALKTPVLNSPIPLKEQSHARSITALDPVKKRTTLTKSEVRSAKNTLLKQLKSRKSEFDDPLRFLSQLVNESAFESEAARFAVLATLRDEAILVGDLEVAAKTNNTILADFDVSEPVSRSVFVRRILKSRSSLSRKIRTLESEFWTSIRSNDFAEARAIAETNSIALRRSRDRRAIQWSKQLAETIGRLEKDYKNFKIADKSIQSDAVSLGKWGQYLCFKLGDFEKGLPFLAQSQDERIQSLAAKDMNANSPVQQAKSADLWWKFANESSDPYHHIYRHAILKYGENLKSLAGVQRAEYLRRLANFLYQTDHTSSSSGTVGTVCAIDWNGQPDWQEVEFMELGICQVSSQSKLLELSWYLDESDLIIHSEFGNYKYVLSSQGQAVIRGRKFDGITGKFMISGNGSRIR